MDEHKILVFKIGGSLLSPDVQTVFDWDYALQLRDFLVSLVNEGYTCGLSVGGGKLNRFYLPKMRELGLADEDQHKVGIAVTNLHAQLLYSLLGNHTHKPLRIYDEYEQFLGQKRVELSEPGVIVTGASKPGFSNDWNALQVAKRLGIKKVFDVKNIDGVYTADPRQVPGAEFIANLTWDKYFQIIGGRGSHEPGASYPVDPKTAAEAEELGVEYVIIGSDLDNLKQAALGGEFKGSVIGAIS